MTERTDIREINETFLNGKAARKVYRDQIVKELEEKKPMLVTCNGIDELRQALPFYRLSIHGMGRMLDCSSYYLDQHVREHVHYIYINSLPTFRKALKDDLIQWTDKPTSRCFFSPEELGEWLRSIATVTIETVCVPLSMFTDDPVRFRRAFLHEKLAYLSEYESHEIKVGLRPWPSIRKWNAFNLLNDEGKELVNDYYVNVKKLYDEQGIAHSKTMSDVKYPGIPARLPEGVFPQLKRRRSYLREMKSLSSAVCRRFARSRGLADVELDIQPDHKTRLTCPGVLLGEPVHWPDFGLGATATMLAGDALEKWGDRIFDRWQFSASECIKSAPGLIEYPIEEYWVKESGQKVWRGF